MNKKRSLLNKKSERKIIKDEIENIWKNMRKNRENQFSTFIDSLVFLWQIEYIH